MTTFFLILGDHFKPGDPPTHHDPAGDAIQTHDMPDGDMLMTFSDDWLKEMDWRGGDTLQLVIQEDVGGCHITNLTKNVRATCSGIES